MKDKAKMTWINFKMHVKNNKFGYAMAGVAVCAVALQQRNVKQFYAFLEEKGINPVEFYCPEYYEEMQNK